MSIGSRRSRRGQDRSGRGQEIVNAAPPARATPTSSIALAAIAIFGIFGDTIRQKLSGAVTELGLDGYSEAMYPLHHYGWSDLRALRAGRYKLIDAPRPELFDLEADPKETTNMFEQRRSLRGVVLVMDIRHPLRPFDEQMLAWCAATGVPCHVLLTKADKLNRGPARATLLQVRKALPAGATAQVFSAHNREGLDDLIGCLDGWYGLEPATARAESGSAGGAGPADPAAATG